MNSNPDWRAEMEQAKKELGPPGVLVAYWLGAAVVLFLLSILIGGIPGTVSLIINILITLLAAVPIALGFGWLSARKKQS
ncbi:MAG TPA: hypothetical protein VM754_13110 [Actinomycetota bacterium]|nr:hypothetical protein [Actinomycetota bacterium]